MSDGKRSYQKRSDYWNSLSKKSEPATVESFYKSIGGSDQVVPELMGESFYESAASTTSTSKTSSRSNRIHKNPAKDRYKNISDGLLPFHYSADSVDVKDAIELCQKACFNVPVCRSTVDLMSEFADSEIYLEGGSAAAKKLIQAWFKRIKLYDLKKQHFREYYRSGNVFFYRFDGKIKAGASKKMIETYGATTKDGIPIKYLLLNPTDIASKATLSFIDKEYCKVLTPYEIARLKKPVSEHEKEMFNALPKELQDKLTSGVGVGSTVHFPLKQEKLHALFYKKQDYEPFAVPMIFPVLDDVNKKLELKKIDQAIARTIENVVLLVTMGAEPDKGGINPANMTAMQNIFKNQSVGRVLVADYTTKAEFIIPDLKKVMGKEKYEILNKDINEGLQNVLLGESKYSDTQLKLKIFMQRLEEARELFLKDFLQPEIKRICLSLGMKNVPEAKFVKTDTLDNSDLQKLVVRMMELGILAPEEGLKVVNTGVFPNGENIEASQEKFHEERKKGFYTPLVNSIQIQSQDDDKKQQEFDNKITIENQKLAKKAAENPAPTASSGSPVKKTLKKSKTATVSGPAGGRPMGTSNAEEYSAKKISLAVKAINEFELRALREFGVKYGMEELEGSKKDLVSKVCETIISSSEITDWDQDLQLAIEDFTSLAGKEPSQPVLEIGERHQLDDLASAILYHSTKVSV
jgi:hypothetical protein